MTRTLEVAIAAGGTAGHINPAIALAEELRSRGHHVTFYGQTAKLEGTLVPQAGFELVPIVVTGFDRSRPWTLVSALVRERSATSQILARFATDEVAFHGLRTRASGHRAFADVHVLVPGTWTVARGHDLVEDIEAALAHEVPDLTLSTHVEPSEDPRSYEDIHID